MKARPILLQPLCGLSLERPVKTSYPFYDVLAGCAGIALLIVRRNENLMCWKELSSQGDHSPYYFELLVRMHLSIGSVWMICLAGLLRRAAISKNIAMLNLWVILIVPFDISRVTIMCTNYFYFDKIFHLHTFVILFSYHLVKLHISYIVRCYAKQLKHEREMNSAVRSLTRDEVQEFENGIPNAINEVVEGNIQKLALYSGYQKHFEIEMNRLSIGWNNPLGKGEFGTVYKGHLDDNNYSTAVAVKVIDPEATDACSFKLMLSELKVMTYVGEHPNVVRLIGANTSEVQQRKLYIILEFCTLGSVLDVLRGSRGLFVNLVISGLVTESNKNIPTSSSVDGDSISTFDLLQWAHQIATGMEFLASKRLVHGDLAARNVLLTEDKVVKITDFGLSRQLYQYSVYVKKSSQPVPWMNLSLESIIDQQFSTHSDVWSYGITLWEMFSLGEVPYPAYTFGNQFIKELRDGMRPSCPPYSPHFIYDLMQSCWNQSPKHRPTFTEIQQSLLSYS